MRIAVVHSFYSGSVPSGENATVLDQVAALQEAGHDVHLLGAWTDTLMSGPSDVIRAVGRSASGYGRNPLEAINDLGPDVVHVHNMFPNYGWRWLRRCRPPLVATVHNYRAFCASGTLFRDGSSCTECVQHGSTRGVIHGCYRSSRLATIPLALGTSRGLGSEPIAHARLLISPSERTARILTGFGVDAGRVRVLPSFVSPLEPIRDNPPPQGTNGRWVVAGRISEEKGIAHLIRMWPVGVSLDVFGSGESSEDLAAHPDVRLLGALPREEFLRVLPNYQGLVFPSLWPETQGLTVAEAFMTGTPVVAYMGSAGADTVAKSGAGRLYDDSESLSQALADVVLERPEMSGRAISAYNENFSKARWTRSIEEIYAFALSRAS